GPPLAMRASSPVIGHRPGTLPAKTKRGPSQGLFSRVSRRRPTLPPRYQGSTIGAGGLNLRDRNGTGCSPSAMATETAGGCEPPYPANRRRVPELDSEREQGHVAG